MLHVRRLPLESEAAQLELRAEGAQLGITVVTELTGYPASIDFEDVALPRLLDRTAAEYGDATALTFLNCRLTYRQLEEGANFLLTLQLTAIHPMSCNRSSTLKR